MSKEMYRELIEIIKKEKPTKRKLARIKINLCKKYNVKEIPTDIKILLHATPQDIDKLSLVTKPTRTISGVAVVAIMSYPFSCPHGKCIVCPGGPASPFGDIPQSYTGKEPATMRALRNNFDSYLQVMNRLEQYIVTGHAPDKVELIIMGGTFPSFRKSYQEKFISYAFKAMNDFSSMFYRKNKFDYKKFKQFFELPGDVGDPIRTKNIHEKLKKLRGKSILEKEQKKNEKSNIRCVGLTLETRPDYAKLKQGKEMLKLGCTRVEIGVQSVYEKALKNIKRGHSVKDTIESFKILKDLGFKINAHYMLGLPGISKEKDLEGLQELFLNPDFKPDMLKIYPCMVVEGTELYKLWKKKKYKPLTTKQAGEIIAEAKRFIPTYCRITRIMRDIPTNMTKAGVDRTNLRQYIEQLTKKKKIKCKCIRCRESGHVLRKNKNIKVGKIKIKVLYYNASDGNEFFISCEDPKNDILFGYCRLRFPNKLLRKEITEDSALIRELHIYSPLISIGKKSKHSYQHRGLGKKLLEKAEEIAKTYYKKKIVIISGIGARRYFSKMNYRKQGPYMVKLLKNP